MKLMTAELKKALPRLYATEDVDTKDKIAVVKFFFPAGRATWYGVEWDGKDEFFGYVVSPLGPDCDEWGYFSLSELESLKVRGLKVERDLYWKPTRIGDLIKES